MIIKKEHTNPLFKRKEVHFMTKSETTPSYADAEKMVSEKFSSKTENVKIKSVKGKFGAKEFMIKAHIYNSKEEKDRIEPKPKEKKK